MFAGVVRIKFARQELKHETELLSKNLGFIVIIGHHQACQTIVNASAIVLRTACKRKASEHDYLVDNFVAADSDFPPTLWAHAPDVMPVTTNGDESKS